MSVDYGNRKVDFSCLISVLLCFPTPNKATVASVSHLVCLSACVYVWGHVLSRGTGVTVATVRTAIVVQYKMYITSIVMYIVFAMCKHNCES